MYGTKEQVEILLAARDRARADYEQIQAAGNDYATIDARSRMWAAEDAYNRASMINGITGGTGRDNEADTFWHEKANAWIIGEKAMQAAEQEAAGFQKLTAGGRELTADTQSAGWEDVLDMTEVEPGVYAVDGDDYSI